MLGLGRFGASGGFGGFLWRCVQGFNRAFVACSKGFRGAKQDFAGSCKGFIYKLA